MKDYDFGESPYWIDGGTSVARPFNSKPTKRIETYQKKLPSAWQCASCGALVYIENKESHCPSCGASYSEDCEALPL